MRFLALGIAVGLGACAAPVPLPPTLSLPPAVLLPPQGRERVPQPVDAPRPPPPTSGPAATDGELRNAFTFAVGAAYWDELGSLSTAGTGWTSDQFGRFDRAGFSLDLGYDRVVGHVGELPWSLGLEWGLASFENDGDGVSRFADRLDATTMRITPVARLVIGLSNGVRLVPGIGLGAYQLSIDEYDEVWFADDDSRTLHDEWAFGGFVDLSLDIELPLEGSSMRIDNEFHWVEFDSIDRLLPAESRVGGLIYALQLGVVFRF